MSKSVLLCLFLWFGVNLFAQQNRFSSHLMIGLVTSQVQGDALAGFDKAGITVGIGLDRRLSKSVEWGFAINYIQKGSRTKTDPDSINYNFYKMALHYIEVPVLFKYRYKKFQFEAGPSFGFLLAAKEENFYGPAAPGSQFKKYELGLVGGVVYKHRKNVSIGIRSAESIWSIRETAAYPKGAFGRYRGQYNTLLSLNFFYHFL